MSLGFRPIHRDDFPLLSRWLGEPHVLTWWRQPHELDPVEAEYGPVVDGVDPTDVLVVEQDGRDVGLIQRYRFRDNPEWERAVPTGTTPREAAGIDYFIGDESLIGRGLGGEIIAAFVEDTWQRYSDVPTIVVAVHQENRRSWRALEKAGFQRIWAGTIESDDASDDGPSYLYRQDRVAG